MYDINLHNNVAMRNLYIILIAIILVPLSALSQNKDVLKDAFFDAEYYMLYEDYDEALSIYLNLLNNGMDNAYINHRIGECYLQIPGVKEKSIPYLEKACKNLSFVIKEGSFKETNAPVRTLFYLACAYQVNNELDKAMQTFKEFEDKLAGQNIYNTDYVEKQITSCQTALELIKNPVDVKISNIGKMVNDHFSNIRPVLSEDGNSMVYVSKLKFYDAVFYTKKVDGQWAEPVNITPQLKSDGDFYSCFLSHDGTILILYKNDKYNRDLYISHLVNGRWSVPEKLNKHINSKYNETFASISSDGKTLYFTSDRKGGYGGLDIYKSNFDKKTNDWGEPINLGSRINTEFNEEAPVICENDTVLYFSSEGHYNMGGYDIFYSDISGNDWTDPVNIGYPINSTDDNIFYYPIENGKQAYMSEFDQRGFGLQDIVMLEFNP